MSLALLLLACAPCPPGFLEEVWSFQAEPVEAGQWPQYRLDPGHSGVAPEGTLFDPGMTLTWKSEAFAIGEYSASKGSPSLSGDGVYVGIDDGVLRKLDAESGALVWEFRTRQAKDEEGNAPDENRGIHGTPAIADGRVFIGAYDGWIYALEAERGELLWERELGGSIGASPTVHGGVVLMAVEYPSPNGRIYALDAETGCVAFESDKVGDHPHSSTTVDSSRGIAFVGANNGSFTAWDLLERKERWTTTTGAEIKSTAAVDGDLVFISSWDTRLHAFDIEDGHRRFSFATGAASMSSPSVYDGVVYVGSHDGYLYAIDADPDADFAEDQERQLWRTWLGDKVLSSPTIVPESGVLLIGSNDGSLAALDLDDGSRIWSQDLGSKLSSVPVVTGRTVLATDASGTTWRWDAE